MKDRELSYSFSLPGDQESNEFEKYCDLFIDGERSMRSPKCVLALREYTDLARETERMCEAIYG